MLKTGDMVRHKKYGSGVVKYIVPEDIHTAPYFVEFDDEHKDLHEGGWRGYYGKFSSCLWLRGGSLSKINKFKGNK